MIIQTYQRHSLRPFELITIAIDPKKDAQKVSDCIKQQHLPLALWTEKSVQQEGRTTNNYHFQGDDHEALAKALAPDWQGPLSYMQLIAPGGEVVWSHQGDISEQELRNVIVDALEKANIR